MSEVDIGKLSDEIAELGMPEKAEWCGDNAIVLSWGGKVIVVGPGGDSLRCAIQCTNSEHRSAVLTCSYDYSPAAVLVGELDGLRIISSGTCDFLQKVPGKSATIRH